MALSALSALALLCAAPLRAQTPTWSAEFLGSIPSGWTNATYPLAVNADGVVAGNTTVASQRRAWVGVPSQGLQLLPVPAGTTWSEVSDINAHGSIVGRAIVSSVTRAILWTPSASGYSALLLPADAQNQMPTDARGINDLGEVVGHLTFFSRSFLWHPSTGTRQLTAFPGIASAINNRRQVLGGTRVMDLATNAVTDLGSPTGTGYRYLFTELSEISDSGESIGYANVATSQRQSKQAVRYTPGVGWKAFNVQPATSANAISISSSGDTVFQVANFGVFVYVDGHGSTSLPNVLDATSSGWDVSNSFVPPMSRAGVLACNGAHAATQRSGIVLLRPFAFTSLGGASDGSAGTPVLDGFAQLRANTPARLRLSSARTNSLALLAFADASKPLRVLGGTLHPELARLVLAPLPLDALGRAAVTLSWPNIAPTSSIWLQGIVLDPRANGGLALSNGLRATGR